MNKSSVVKAMAVQVYTRTSCLFNRFVYLYIGLFTDI